MKKGKVQIQLTITTSSHDIMFDVPQSLRDIQPAAWNRFRKQIRSWKGFGSAEAEEKFIKTYVPEARVIPEEERGLTDGLVFAYRGNLYWDRSYEVQSFLEILARDGRYSLVCVGPEVQGEDSDE